MIAAPRFWLLLLLVVIGVMVSLFLWNYFLPESSGLSTFTLICVGTFILINVIAYYAGRRSVMSSSKYRFVQLMMGLIMLKMVICVVLVVAYIKINEPSSKLFVLPFLTLYLLFTLFEIYVLEKTARHKPSTISK